ncbi:MAG: hypothetical protein IJB47_06925 [Oscillospiraceae bacterium]|nr:hypothetical protein [Oscillospiraceae bacterium]
MSYYVEYNPEVSRQYPVRRLNKNKGFGNKLIILTLILGLIACMTSSDVRDFLIPGDAATTVYAATELLDNMKDGAPLLDAFAVFCEMVAGNGS